MERNSIKLQDNVDNNQLRLHFYCANPDPIIVDGNFKTITETPAFEVKKPSSSSYDIISELATEDDSEKEIDESEVARKMSARAILTVFAEWGDYSKDRSLLKNIDKNRQLREKFNPEQVRNRMKSHLELANNIIAEHLNDDIVKNILGFDFEAKDDNGNDLYIDEQDFKCAIRRKYFPEESRIDAEHRREEVRKILKEIADIE